MNKWLIASLLMLCGFTCQSCTYEYNFLVDVQNHQRDQHSVMIRITGSGAAPIERVLRYNQSLGVTEVWYNVPDNKRGEVEVFLDVTDLQTGESRTHKWRLYSGNRINNAEIIRYHDVKFR